MFDRPRYSREQDLRRSVRDAAMAMEVGLAPYERVVMRIAHGWPDPEGVVPYSGKRENEQLRVFG